MAGEALSAKRWFCGQGFFCNSEKARRNANFLWRGLRGRRWKADVLRRSAGDVSGMQTFNGEAQRTLADNLKRSARKVRSAFEDRMGICALRKKERKKRKKIKAKTAKGNGKIEKGKGIRGESMPTGCKPPLKFAVVMIREDRAVWNKPVRRKMFYLNKKRKICGCKVNVN